MSNPFVAVLMGSDSDLPTVKTTLNVLSQLQVAHEAKISSAHRTPTATRDYVVDAEARGCQVFIAAAGLAAHLAGTVAGLTTKPVIGIPLAGGPLNGFDALLSTAQMPGGVPVATVSIGTDGAQNAAFLAAQILALCDPALAERVQAARTEATEAVIAKDAKLQEGRLSSDGPSEP